MNCIIVDDEPLAREAMKLLIEESDNLQLIGSFNSAATASRLYGANRESIWFFWIFRCLGLQE